MKVLKKIGSDGEPTGEWTLHDVDESLVMFVYDGLRLCRDRLVKDINSAVTLEQAAKEEGNTGLDSKQSEELNFLSLSLSQVTGLMFEIEQSGIPCG